MRTIIIDDNEEARILLADDLFIYCPYVELIGQAKSGTEGIELIKELNPDLVFLDVEMPDLDGFQVLKALGKVNFALIFVTSYNQYAVQAFEFNAIDYLLKPVEGSRLIVAVEKVRERNQLWQTKTQYQFLLASINSSNPPDLSNRIVFSTQEEIFYVTLKNLIRIEADGNCCSVYVERLEKKIFLAKNLGTYERLFQSIPFMFRVHRGHIVNLYHVTKFIREEGGYLELTSSSTTNDRIPVSKGKRLELLKKLEEL